MEKPAAQATLSDAIGLLKHMTTEPAYETGLSVEQKIQLTQLLQLTDKNALNVDAVCRRLEELRTPSDRLLIAILDIDTKHHKNCVTMLPDYNEGQLWQIAKDSLPDQKLAIVKAYVGFYQKPQTVNQIAYQYDLTVNTVQRYINESIRKLRTSYTLQTVFPGMAVNKAVCGADITGDIQTVDTRQPIDTDIPDIVNTKPIVNTKCSSRTTFALRRANITTIGQLARMELNDILKVRGLGIIGFGEIVNLLDKHGIHRQDLINYKEERCNGNFKK